MGSWKPALMVAVGWAVFRMLLLAAAGHAAGQVEPNVSRPQAAIGIELARDWSAPGACISAVRVGSPADNAGLTYGDRIMAVDGVDVENWQALQRILTQGQVGVARHLTVNRGDTTFDVTVIPVDPGGTSKYPRGFFIPLYRTPCASYPSPGVVPFGGIVAVALALWGALHGARLRVVLWACAAWLTNIVAANVAAASLCRLLGGPTLGGSLVSYIVADVILVAFGARLLRRLPQLASSGGVRTWHAAVRLGAIYLLGAVSLTVPLVYAMNRLMPPVTSRHTFAEIGRLSLALGSGPVLVFLIEAIVIGPVAEEVLFRGVLLPWLASWMPEWKALAVSSAMFGAAHLGYGYGMLGPAASGWVLGWARQRTAGLKAPIVLHMMVNATCSVWLLTTGETRVIVMLTLLLAIVAGGASLIDDSAYRATVDKLQRSKLPSVEQSARAGTPPGDEPDEAPS